MKITKNINTLFKQTCRENGFVIQKNSAKRSFDNMVLILNIQKSRYAKIFYINVVILYKDLLDESFDEYDVNVFFSVNTVCPIIPHLSGRIHNIVKDKLTQKILDQLYENADFENIYTTLNSAIHELVLMCENGDLSRDKVREMKDNKQLNALVWKEV